MDMCWNGQGTTVHHESHSGSMNYNNMNVGEVLKIHVDMDEVVNIDVNGDEGKWVLTITMDFDHIVGWKRHWALLSFKQTMPSWN